MKTLISALALLAFSAGVFGVAQLSADTPAPAEILSPKLRGFLKNEMRLLVDAGRALEKALAAEDSKAVKKFAGKIQETFVHKDEVTTFDLREFQAALGDDFVARDKAFHAMARQLEVAAGKGDMAKQKMLFGEMLNVCAACHAAYAPKASVLE